MKFTMVGEIYCDADVARRYRRMARFGELPEGVMVDLSVNREYEREIQRHYPFCVTIRAYEIDREAFQAAQYEFSLYPTKTETMGILGGDGGIGWTPAMAWEHESDAYNGSFGSVYVTPWPEAVRPITHGHSWERVAKAVYNTFR